MITCAGALLQPGGVAGRAAALGRPGGQGQPLRHPEHEGRGLQGPERLPRIMLPQEQ